MTATRSGGTPRPAPDPGQRDPTTTTGSEAAHVPPVAIVGIGCRLPGAAGVGEFWRLLHEGRDAATAPPRNRAGGRRGGYLDRLDAFDNDWFAISEREAAVMDPQQRLGLEVAVEALDDAGVGYRVRGSRTAVLFGACGYDHGTVVLGHGGHDAPYAVTGSALSIIANRLSYALDLHGPSLVLDSACSSSLTAVDMAVRLLADDTAELAIVGGVNLPLLQHTSDYLDQSGFLAPDGQCKPFDAAADGYTRSDGCTVLILQRTADAHREGNRVYAEIVGTAVGSDGRSNGLYAPNGLAQQQVIRRAWARAGATPATAGFVECHGTGTPLGDAVEVGALAAVLSGSARTGPVRIGSVKSNLGHLEAAAGVTGVAKAALSIAHATIVPNVHFHTENPLLKLGQRGLAVPTEPIGWAAESASGRYAGVSSFGFGGTNAHVVLRGVDSVVPQRETGPPVLFAISGRDEDDLADRVLRWAEALRHETGSVGESASAAARSISEDVRAAVVARDRADAVARLLELADEIGGVPEAIRARIVEATTSTGNSGTVAERVAAASPTAGTDPRATTVAAPETPTASSPIDTAARNTVTHTVVGDSRTHPGRVYGPSGKRRRGRILLVFSGQGGQHARMGRALAARYPVFARTLAEATDAVVAAGGPRVWTPRHGFAHSLDATDVVQPALFVFQIALAELLAHWGIHPDAVVGHSLGEIAAAVVGGALSLGDGARITVARSAILAQLDGRGAMAMVEATPEEAGRLVEPVRAHVAVAAVNGPRSVVVSGTPRYVETLIRRATRRNIYARRIAVDFAAHSPQVHEPAAELITRLDAMTPSAPRIPLYSTTRRGEMITSAAMDAKYWAENAERTVELAAALDAAAADGCTTAIEISPHPVLAPAIREFPDFRDATHSMAHRDDEATAFLDGMARLYLEGRPADWSALGTFTGPKLERRWKHNRFPLLTVAETGPGDEELGDHIVRGVPMVPAVYWLRRLLRIGGTTRLAEFTVREPTNLVALGETTFHTGTDLLAVNGPATLATARRAADPTPAEIVGWMRAIDAHRIAEPGMRPIDTREFYAMLRARGLAYGPRFRPLRGIVAGFSSAIGLLGHIPMNTAALDGCLQLIAAAAGPHLPADVLPLPARIDSAWLTTSPEILLAQAHAYLRHADPDGLTCDVLVTDQHGAPAAALLGIHIHFAHLPGNSATGTMAHSHTATTTYEWPTDAPPAFGHTADDSTTPIDTPGHESFRADRGNPIVRQFSDALGSRIGYRTGTGDSGPAVHIPDDPDPSARGSQEPRNMLRRESWAAIGTPDIERALRSSRIRRVLVIGESRLAVGLTRAVDRWVPGERVARDPAEASPIVAATLTGRDAPTAVVAVWPAVSAPGPAVREIGRALELLQRIQQCDAVASLTVVLRDHRSVTQQGIAGLVRSLQLESGRPVRLVWAGAERAEPGPLAGLALSPDGPDEVRITPGGLAARRFEPVPFLARPVEIRPVGAYVVTGGLGALGAVAARWLLDSGAGDVVVLTRHPRPLPPLLEGLEDRIVVLRCDVTDPRDLANALHDIRECGSPIRGLVHSAGTLRDAEFGAVTTDLLTSMFETKLSATADLLDLTAADPIDFALLFSSATGALGAPGQAAYAAANAALDALAAARANRGVISIGWGSWESGLVATAGGAEHLRRAGITPFTTARGTAVLDCLRGYPGSYVLAMDYTPTTDDSPISRRLRAIVPAMPPNPPPDRSLAPFAAPDITAPRAGQPERTHYRFGTGHLGPYGIIDNPGTTYPNGPTDLPHSDRHHTDIGYRTPGVPANDFDHEYGSTDRARADVEPSRTPDGHYRWTSRNSEQTATSYAQSGEFGASAHWEYSATHESAHTYARIDRTRMTADLGPDGNPLADNATTGDRPARSNVDYSGHSLTTADSEVALPANTTVVQTLRMSLATTLDIAVEAIDPDADFADLGLSSLLAIELRRMLEARLGIRISTGELFEYPTVARLAAALSTRLPDELGEIR